MKILCVGSHRSPSNAWRRVLTLRRMGHEVETLDTSGRIFFRSSTLTSVVNRMAGRFLRQKLAAELFSKVRNFRPELIFVEKGTWLAGEVLDKVRTIGPQSMKLAHYNPDDPFGSYKDGWSIFKAAVPEYDIHFVPKTCNVPEYQALGARRVEVFDRSYDPTLHRPVELTVREKLRYECDVGFIGTWAPEREASMAALVKAGLPLAIWGNGWQHGSYWPQLKRHHRGSGQYDEDYVKCINGMKIALHFLRHENRDLQDSRTFEIPACGTFMLAEWSEDHERLFKPNQEAVYFHDDEELLQHVQYYLHHGDERRGIAAAGLKAAQIGAHRHEDRLEWMLRLVEEASQ